MVLALPYGGVRQAFSSDTARIRLAMAAVGGQGSRSETGSDMACRTRRFLESLHGFLEGQAGRSTPLTVVLFTAGLAAPRRDAPMARAPGMCELPVSHFQMISAAAGAARANFYVLQPSDIGFNAAGWTESIAGTSFLGSDNPLEGIEHLAGATGAVRLALDGTGTESVARVTRESSSVLRRRSRGRAARGVRAQPEAGGAGEARRRDRARPPRDHLHGTWRQDDPAGDQRSAAVAGGRTRPAAAHRGVHRTRARRPAPHRRRHRAGRTRCDAGFRGRRAARQRGGRGTLVRHGRERAAAARRDAGRAGTLPASRGGDRRRPAEAERRKRRWRRAWCRSARSRSAR